MLKTCSVSFEWWGIGASINYISKQGEGVSKFQLFSMRLCCKLVKEGGSKSSKSCPRCLWLHPEQSLKSMQLEAAASWILQKCQNTERVSIKFCVQRITPIPSPMAWLLVWLTNVYMHGYILSKSFYALWRIGVWLYIIDKKITIDTNKYDVA